MVTRTTTPVPADDSDDAVLVLAYVGGVVGVLLILFCTCYWVRRIRWKPGRKYIQRQREKTIAMQAAVNGQPLILDKKGHPVIVTVKEQEKIRKKEMKKSRPKMLVQDIKMERLQRRKGIITNGHSMNEKKNGSAQISKNVHMNGYANSGATRTSSISSLRRSQAFYGSFTSIELPSLDPIHENIHHESPEEHFYEDIDGNDLEHVIQCDVHVSADKREDQPEIPAVVVHREFHMEDIESESEPQTTEIVKSNSTSQLQNGIENERGIVKSNSASQLQSRLEIEKETNSIQEISTPRKAKKKRSPRQPSDSLSTDITPQTTPRNSSEMDDETPRKTKRKKKPKQPIDSDGIQNITTEKHSVKEIEEIVDESQTPRKPRRKKKPKLSDSDNTDAPSSREITPRKPKDSQIKAVAYDNPSYSIENENDVV